MARLTDHDTMGHETPRAVAEEASMGTDIGNGGEVDVSASFTLGGSGSGTVQSQGEDVYGNPIINQPKATVQPAAPPKPPPHIISATAIANRAMQQAPKSPPQRKIVSAGMTHILANEQKAMTKIQTQKGVKLVSFLLTIGGGAVGFLVAGPVGAGIGAVLGGGADYVRAHHTATPSTGGTKPKGRKGA